MTPMEYKRRRHSSFSEKPPILANFFSVDTSGKPNVLSDTFLLPNFNIVPRTERPVLLIRKLKQCTCANPIVDDAASNSRTYAYCEMKRQALMDILRYIENPQLPSSSDRPLWTPEALVAFFRMFQANVFRPLPASGLESDGVDPAYYEPKLDHNWPILQPIYEIFLRVLVSPMDRKQFHRMLPPSFISKLIGQFSTEDTRELDYLKTALHRIYVEATAYRPLIRRQMNAAIHTFMATSQPFSGIPEFLEIYSSIINGFSMPLKPEHASLFKQTLLPLHKADNISSFSEQLLRCSVQMARFSGLLGVDIVSYLCRVFPQTCTAKAVFFLDELECIAGVVAPDVYPAIAPMLLKILPECIRSDNFRISDRAIAILNSEDLFLTRVLALFPGPMLDRLVHPLAYVILAHWNEGLAKPAAKALHRLIRVDPVGVYKRVRSFKEAAEACNESRVRSVENWATLLDQCAQSANARSSMVAHAKERAALALPPAVIYNVTGDELENDLILDFSDSDSDSDIGERKRRKLSLLPYETADV
ncbi:Phosphatidate cytidylyltransferase [Carpediemonas membranifera]|uniref:Phosphatidate cytidylyltransferase n=1 Tax=Carpediemonas membranifera TaxID=201153 RepID=A0A8J6AU31_9EUKA|nr:Phosphatidate cytidylyltransferase [Carpediemonas membranifera]|eukprot:KAG9392480.1 Phosphatidate cytidylyltransferase [Carpediemonas membranifera]